MADTRSARERLANPWWRLRHSAWMIPALIGIGVLAWVSFVYVAARTRRPLYVGIAGFFLVAGALGGFWPDDANNTAGGILVFVWAAAIVTALVINPGYLRWRAARGASDPGVPSGLAGSPGPAGSGAPSASGSAPTAPHDGPQDTIRRPGQARGPVFGESGRWETPER